MYRLSFIAGILIILATIIACTPEESSQQDQENKPEARSNKESTRDATTSSSTEQATKPSPSVGEAVDVGDLSIRVFDVRAETTVDFISDRAASPEVRESSGEYVAVDYVAENTSGAPVILETEAAIEDSQGSSYPLDETIDVRSGGETAAAELGPAEKRASTMFFEVPGGTTPTQLNLENSGEQVKIDLTGNSRSEIPSDYYLYVYHAYFNQRAYEEIYEMLDPATTQGITLGVWLMYFESVWGQWYLSLEALTPISSTPSEASYQMDRTFYGTDDSITTNSVVQEMFKDGDEWKLILRDDQANDILAAQAPETTGPEITSPETTLAEPSPAPGPDPDPDPDPDPNAPIPNDPSLPSGGIDCSTSPSNIPVVPGSDGDGDDDGVACEE